jgi:hypothetical protein
MMTASGRKKRLFTLVGLLVLLVVGLLWHGATLMHSSGKGIRKAIPGGAGPLAAPAVVTKKLAASASAETAGVGTDPMIVRKKLPPGPPPVLAAAPPVPVAVEPAPPPAPEPSLAPTLGPTPDSGPPPTVVAAPPLPALEPLGSAPLPPPAASVKSSAAPPLPAVGAKRASYPFSILLSSCREKENALAALAEFRRAGAVYIARFEVKGRGAWWRVLTGVFKTADEASQAKKALGVPGAVVVRTPFANRLGIFASEAAAADTAARVNAMGYFPYFLQGANGAVELVAGAFLTEAEADALQAELKVQGVSTEIIRR